MQNLKEYIRNIRCGQPNINISNWTHMYVAMHSNACTVHGTLLQHSRVGILTTTITHQLVWGTHFGIWHYPVHNCSYQSICFPWRLSEIQVSTSQLPQFHFEAHDESQVNLLQSSLLLHPFSMDYPMEFCFLQTCMSFCDQLGPCLSSLQHYVDLLL